MHVNLTFSVKGEKHTPNGKMKKKKKTGQEGEETLAEMDRSALCRLDVRVGRLPWSTAQGLLLFSIIFDTFIPYTP